MQFSRALRQVLVVLLMSVVVTPAFAADETFVVRNIEVQGLQRISTGTLYTYLPISVGDQVDAQRIGSAIKALYHTGFFANIQMRRSGNTLIVSVDERPSIADFSIVGNKAIKTENLTKALDRSGLAKGRILNRSVLNDVKQELMRQYFSHGKYNAKVDIKVKPTGNNRVDVTINISEGVDTKIKSINIVGNSTFDDETLLDTFKLEPTQWYALFQKSDKYVRETLSGDLESLRSYYMDQGYADFRINSIQVTISPDYKHIFITINVHEGEVYKIGKVELAGRFVIPEERLRDLVLAKPGMTYSMARAQYSTDLMTDVLGNQGYAFAKVNPVPKLDREAHRVDLTFVVEPGNRVYVRRINFSGMPETDDLVFRREMRQLEGTWLSNFNLKRSKLRLQRVPFIKSVEESTDPVPGSPDLVDLNYKLTGQKVGKFFFAVGYSPYFGVSLNAGIEHYNFLGEGNTVSVNLNTSEIRSVYDLSWTDPYATINGVSRTIRAYYRESSALVLDSSPLDTKSYGLLWSYGIPASEVDSFQLGASASQNELLTTAFASSQQAIDFASNPDNGELFKTFLGPAIRYREYSFLTGWLHDSRNRAIFATRGNRERVSLEVAAPFSDVTYYKLTYHGVQYVPLGGGFIYRLSSGLGLNKTYGGSDAVPPTEYYTVGGPDSVRGYRSGFLGPLDSNHFPVGGNFQFYAQNELIIPTGLGGGGGAPSAQFGVFFDIGNAFPEAGDFQFGELYKSAGIAGQFITPLGIMRVSLGWPLNSDVPGYLRETFQFSVGRRF
ncbi:MAG TPA: outer membrane protein assembly factor BamA [Gammaproteobacteria bacterium]|nr:outer membrane protein assembly factor BamA [Gammaproteobacteria bacterium]